MDGCSDNVTGIEIEPVGDMAGEAPPATSFTFSYRTCLQKWDVRPEHPGMQ